MDAQSAPASMGFLIFVNNASTLSSQSESDASACDPHGAADGDSDPIEDSAMKPSDQNVYVYDSHHDAEEAIRSLGKAGFDVKQLSLVGKGYHTEEHPVGFYSTGDRVKSWGATGAFWGGIWGMLIAPAVFLLPGVGVLAMAGPVVSVLVGALEGAILVGGISVLGAVLKSIGVDDDEVVKYETALKADKYLLIVHGTPEELSKARTVLHR
ncbi:hypothetical protein N5D61_12725 [Pseudomonas sp. GD03842]|uniref:hypothetical protein n=1 Tax=Pseudomonas sp. GD03842 TaxID=2975385 RepID=UPI0024480CC7|nr:hypothetical protein [Pseudomonas sp. GD03842]MDH0747206.1 hypothetical protein [Pseudomonas sp. GD03842]